MMQVNKSMYASLTNNKESINRITITTNYFKLAKNTQREINHFIDSIDRFKTQILDFEIVNKYYKDEISLVSYSLSYFIFFYYREFGVNIMNSAYPCLDCKKFNFLEDS